MPKKSDEFRTLAEEYRNRALQAQEEEMRRRLGEISRTFEELAEHLDRLELLEKEQNGKGELP
jgi:prefoldin subunit 5